MDEDRASRFQRQHPGGARVVEVNMGGEHPPEIAEREPRLPDAPFKSFYAASGTWIEEDESTVGPHQE